MATSRVDQLRAFIAARPQDPFPRYALALEHKNAGQLAEAWSVWETLLSDQPDYTPAYLHAGATLVALGRADDAREVWQRGVSACARKGDHHARGELESALLSGGG
jgi:tetratricopeptide (TPR) repeat protein